MADGRHLEKSRIGQNYASVWPTGAKFGMLMHIDPPDYTGISNFKLVQIQDGGRPPSWKLEEQ